MGTSHSASSSSSSSSSSTLEALRRFTSSFDDSHVWSEKIDVLGQMREDDVARAVCVDDLFDAMNKMRRVAVDLAPSSKPNKRKVRTVLLSSWFHSSPCACV